MAALWTPVWVPAAREPEDGSLCVASGWGLLLSFLAPLLLWLSHLLGQLLLGAPSRSLEFLSASPLDIPLSVSWSGVGNSFEMVLAAGLNTPPLPPVKLPRRAAGPWLTLGTRCIWDPSVMKSLEKASCLLAKHPRQLPSKLAQADYLLNRALRRPGTSPPRRHVAWGRSGCCRCWPVRLQERLRSPFVHVGTCQAEPLGALLPPRFVQRVP